MNTVLGAPFQLLVNVNIESAVNMAATHWIYVLTWSRQLAEVQVVCMTLKVARLVPQSWSEYF